MRNVRVIRLHERDVQRFTVRHRAENHPSRHRAVHQIGLIRLEFVPHALIETERAQKSIRPVKRQHETTQSDHLGAVVLLRRITIRRHDHDLVAHLSQVFNQSQEPVLHPADVRKRTGLHEDRHPSRSIGRIQRRARPRDRSFARIIAVLTASLGAHRHRRARVASPSPEARARGIFSLTSSRRRPDDRARRSRASRRRKRPSAIDAFDSRRRERHDARVVVCRAPLRDEFRNLKNPCRRSHRSTSTARRARTSPTRARVRRWREYSSAPR